MNNRNSYDLMRNAETILRNKGYDIDNNNIIPDEDIHRFGSKKKHWYICFDNWIIAGDWSGALPEINQAINSDMYDRLSSKEKQALQGKIKEQKDTLEQSKITEQKEAAIKAQRLWNNFSENGTSEYLNRKNFSQKFLNSVVGIKYGKEEGKSFVATAIYNNNNNIISLQYIYDNGSKSFMKGGKTKGGFSFFGNKNAQKIYLCEGVATALSILNAEPNVLVVVTYNIGNLRAVGEVISTKYPKAYIIIAADNDTYQTSNIGKETAIEVANWLHFHVTLPQFGASEYNHKPTDFDDLRQLNGVEEVKKQLNNIDISNKLKPILSNQLKPIQKFNSRELLPFELQNFVLDNAKRMNVPDEMVAIPLITAFSSLISGKAVIQPKKNDDSFIIHPNIWGVIIGSPSTKKTASLDIATFFLEDLEHKARNKYKEENNTYQKELKQYNLELQGCTQEYSKAQSKGLDTQNIQTKLNNLKEPEKCFEERYAITYSSTQKLTAILECNKNTSILLKKDELSGFIASLDKKENEKDRSYFLESWNGNATIRDDTIGRGSIFVSNVAISIIGTTQPDHIKNYVNKAKDLNDGLLPRFQLAVYPDNIEYEYIDEKPNKEANDTIKAIAEFLDKSDLRALCSSTIQQSAKEYACFSFHQQAQKIYQNWVIENETKIRSYDHDNPFLSQHISKYGKLLPAISLIFHLVQYKKEDKFISEETLNKSIKFCAILESHANRIYTLTNSRNNSYDSAIILIEEIKNKIKANDQLFLGNFTKRDVSQKLSKYRKENLTLEKSLKLLVEHKYLIITTTPSAYQQKEKIMYRLSNSFRRMIDEE